MSCIHCINPEMSGGNPEAPLSYSSSTIFVAPRLTSPISGQLWGAGHSRPLHTPRFHISQQCTLCSSPAPVNSSPQHHLRIPIFPNEIVDFCKPCQNNMPFHEPPWPEIQTHQLPGARRSWPTSPSSTESPTSPCAEQIAVISEFGK